MKKYITVLIPEVRFDTSLKAIQKILLSEIDAISKSTGWCFASVKYFADAYGINERTIQRHIKSMITQNYLEERTNTLEGNRRELRPQERYRSKVKFTVENNICIESPDNFVQSADNPVVSSDNLVQLADNPVVLSDNSVGGGDKTVGTNDKTVGANDNFVQSSDNPVVLGDRNVTHNNISFLFINKKNNRDESEGVKKLIDLINEKSIRENIAYDDEDSVQKIMNWINQGYSFDDLESVVNKKYDEWKGKDQHQWIRPQTLFAEKHFKKYLGEAAIIKTKSETNNHNASCQSNFTAFKQRDKSDVSKLLEASRIRERS